MANYHKPEAKLVSDLKDIANKLRIHSVTSTNAGKSGHPSSCSSMAEIMSVLFFNTMRYKITEPRDPSSDRFILSKGHAAPILYAAWAEAGLFPVSDLMKLRKIDSDLEGHPTPRLNFVDVATGSLGQGLSVAAGMAYAGKFIDNAPYRVFCLVGDGESAEGSIWEALHFAGHYKLDNLVAIFDVNRLGQSEATSLQHDLETYRKRLDAFGFNALVVDGHNVEELCKAFHEASETKGRPTAIIAKTFKGKSFPEIEDMDNWHGKPLGNQTDLVVEHLKGLIKNAKNNQLIPSKPVVEVPKSDIANLKLPTPPAYKVGDIIATRLAYGNAIERLASTNKRVIALDGDTKNSTFSDKVLKKFPNQYIECYIAEQNLIGVGIGIACRDRAVAFCSTFATFFTRAFDQLRMGAISQTNLNCVGSHAGISIGEDGPSQMGLEDIALFRSIPNATVFYPSDGVSCEYAVELAANQKGICFIRTSRPETKVLYDPTTKFEIGKCHVPKSSPNDKVLVIGCGITLHEALDAAEILAKEKIDIRVLDPFTIKPIDQAAIIKNAKECGGRIITVEDHYAQGGLGEAVMSAVAMERDIIVKVLAVREIPRSGPSKVLMEMFGIGAQSIATAAREMVSK